MDNNLESFAKTASDFDLCDALSGALEDHYDDILEEAPLSEEEKTVYYVWGVGGFINVNGFGGLWGLLLEYPQYEEFAQALANIGNDEQGKVVLESLSVFSGNELPVGGVEVVKFFGSNEELQEAARPYQSRYWELDDKHEVKLAEYIRRRLPCFLHLEDELLGQ